MITKLAKVQASLKAPKNQFNKFGNYKYRSCEDILEAVKPLLLSEGLVLTVSDSIELVGDRYYVKATATVTDGDKSISVSAYARESAEKKGMDASQITGSASSYARKYALNGLFSIDDNKDADAANDEGKGKKQGVTPQATPQVTPQVAPQAAPTIKQQTAELLRNFGVEANKAGISNEVIGKVIQFKYHKPGKELSMAEASELASKFYEFQAEMVAGEAKKSA